MPSLPFNPMQEKARLFSALATLETQWDKPHMAQAVADFRGVLAHAESVLAALDQESPAGPDAAHHVLGLRLQVEYAQEALIQAEQVLRGTLGPPTT